MTDLLNCPFCGGAGKLNDWATWYVECVDCRVRVIGLTQSDAVDYWNTRHITPMEAAAGAMLEALINAERALSDYACRDPDKQNVPCIRSSGQCAAECGDVASIALGWTRAAITLATGETK